MRRNKANITWSWSECYNSAGCSSCIAAVSDWWLCIIINIVQFIFISWTSCVVVYTQWTCYIITTVANRTQELCCCATSTWISWNSTADPFIMWLSVWSKVLTCIWPSWCHCHSLSLASVKSRLVLPFWYRLTCVIPEKEPLNGCVCGCVCFVCQYQSKWLAVKTASEMTYTVSGGALNSTQTKPNLPCCMSNMPSLRSAYTALSATTASLYNRWLPYVFCHLLPNATGAENGKK